MKKLGIGAAIVALALPGLWFIHSEEDSAPKVSNERDQKGAASSSLPAPGFASMEEVLDPDRAPVSSMPIAVPVVQWAEPVAQPAKRHVTKKRRVKDTYHPAQVIQKALDPTPDIPAAPPPVSEPTAVPDAIDLLAVVMLENNVTELSRDELPLPDDQPGIVMPCLEEPAPDETGLAAHSPAELPHPLFGTAGSMTQ